MADDHSIAVLKLPLNQQRVARESLDRGAQQAPKLQFHMMECVPLSVLSADSHDSDFA